MGSLGFGSPWVVALKLLYLQSQDKLPYEFSNKKLSHGSMIGGLSPLDILIQGG
jgi:hypothetical protein